MIQHHKWLISIWWLILAVISNGQTNSIDTRTGHTAAINAIAISPDGKILVSGSDDHTIKLWNLATGKEERTINTDDEVNSMAFSSDGKMLLILSGISTSLWDMQTGKKLRSFDGSFCDSVAFSLDSKLILCGHDDEVKLLYTDTGEEALTISAAKSPAIFMAKDKKIISASGDDLIRIWDAETGKRLQTIEDVGEVKQIAVSADGRFMVCFNGSLEANDEERVQLYNLLTGRKIIPPKSKIKKPDENDLEADTPPGSFAFSPNGKFLAIGYTSYKGSVIKLINPLSGAIIGEIKEGDSNKPEWKQLTSAKKDTVGKLIAFSPDGTSLASIGDNDKTVHLWNVTTRKLQRHLQGHSVNIEAVGFSEDSKRLLSVTDEGSLLWWDLKTQKLDKLFSISIDPYKSFELSADAKIIIYDAINESKNELRIYDTDTDKNLHSFPTGLSYWALSQDKKIIAGGSFDYIKLFDVNTESEIRTIIWEKSGGIGLSQIAFDPSGKTLAARSNKWIKLWDISTGKEINSFDLDGLIGSIVFNPQKNILAYPVTSKDYSSKTVKLIDLGTGKEIGSFFTGSDEGVAFSLEGNLIAVVSKGEDSIIFFDISTSKEVKRVSLAKKDNRSVFKLPEDGSVKKLSLSPDGKYLAIATTKGVRLFDLTTGQELSPLI